MLYHVNSETGNAGKCSATKGKCPFGSADEHFTSQEAAVKAYENTQASFTAKKKIENAIAHRFPKFAYELPKDVERKISRKLAKDLERIQQLESDPNAFALATIEELLTPPIYSMRPRGSYFTRDGFEELLNRDEYMIAIHSRQGGGNRECWCDDDQDHDTGCLAENNEELEAHPQFVSYEDDDFDSTYTTHYFRGGFNEDHAEAVRTAEAKLREYNELKNSHEEVDNGKPLWIILSKDNQDHQFYKSALTSAASSERNATAAAAALPALENALTKIKSNDKLSKEELDAAFDATQMPKLHYMRDRFHESLRSFQSAFTEVENVRKITKEAEDLSEGELKDYLLKDRGTGSYNGTEKRGRSTVKVVKTYSKGSLLGKEFEEAERFLKNTAVSAKKYTDVLKSTSDAYKAEVKLSKERKVETEKLRRRAWAAGWPGLKKDLPPIPESF